MNEEVESLMIFGSAHAIISKDKIDDYDWETLPEYKTKINKLS